MRRQLGRRLGKEREDREEVRARGRACTKVEVPGKETKEGRKSRGRVRQEGDGSCIGIDRDRAGEDREVTSEERVGVEGTKVSRGGEEERSAPYRLKETASEQQRAIRETGEPLIEWG